MKDYILERRAILKEATEEARVKYEKLEAQIRDAAEELKFHQAELNQFDLKYHTRDIK